MREHERDVQPRLSEAANQLILGGSRGVEATTGRAKMDKGATACG
jgi:hypothetical protein